MVQALGPLMLGLAVASLAASAAGVWISIRIAHRVGVLDIPNERSSHSMPTPRMGGVPMVAAVVLPFGCWALVAADGTSVFGSLSYVVIFAFSMSALGFWDDLQTLSPLFRFLVQLSLAILVLLTVFLHPPAGISGVSTVTGLAGLLVGSLWVVWMLNLYNFMDGIDGLAGGEAVMAASFLFLVFVYHQEWGWAAANLFVAAASAGFLLFNWPPARVFMGDAGSAFLGAFFGMQTVVASVTTAVPFFVLVLPFSNFILDTTVTLIVRMCRREKWYRAHRSHFYQRMTALGISHAKVTGYELASVLLSCLAAGIYLSTGDVFLRVAVLAGVGVVLLYAGSRIRRMEQERFLHGSSSGSEAKN